MFIEQKRLCGYRKVGAMYLVGNIYFEGCHRLPVKIPEIKFFRGYKEINPYKLIGKCNRIHTSKNVIPSDVGCVTCSICNPPDEDLVHGLMFVGEQYYTPGKFIKEVLKLGVSKRISNIPNGLVLGKTIVYLAYKKMPFKIELYGIGGLYDFDGTEYIPSIFMAFKPERVEMLIRNSDATEEKLEKLKSHSITPVIVPDNYKHRK